METRGVQCVEAISTISLRSKDAVRGHNSSRSVPWDRSGTSRGKDKENVSEDIGPGNRHLPRSR